MILFSKKIKPIKQTKPSLHKSFRKLFVLAQIFGYLPVQGVLKENVESLHFNWISIKVFYAFVTILGALFLSVMQMHKMITKQMDIAQVDRFAFNFFGVITGILFMKYAINYPKLMVYWDTVDVSLSHYRWPPGLDRRLNAMITFLMGMALGR